MDERLWHIVGKRPTRLRRSDLPQLAQAIVDVERGRAVARRGFVQNTSYVLLQRNQAYNVFVRGDDWAKIVPFLRNSTLTFQPVVPPPTPPPPILSPQPNQVMQPPPQNPYGGFTSFLDGFTFAEQSQIQRLLTTASIDQIDTTQSSGPIDPSDTPPPLNPPPIGTLGNSTNPQEQQFFEKVLLFLQQLFPDDFPTSPL